MGGFKAGEGFANMLVEWSADVFSSEMTGFYTYSSLPGHLGICSWEELSRGNKIPVCFCLSE